MRGPQGLRGKWYMLLLGSLFWPWASGRKLAGAPTQFRGRVTSNRTAPEMHKSGLGTYRTGNAGLGCPFRSLYSIAKLHRPTFSPRPERLLPHAAFSFDVPIALSPHCFLSWLLPPRPPGCWTRTWRWWAPPPPWTRCWACCATAWRRSWDCSSSCSSWRARWSRCWRPRRWRRPSTTTTGQSGA